MKIFYSLADQMVNFRLIAKVLEQLVILQRRQQGEKWEYRKKKITRPAFEGMWLSLQDSFCRFQAALWFAPAAMC
jgi:hypothetical protein